MRSRLSPLFALVCSCASSACFAADDMSAQGVYIGLFGGFGSASATSMRQEGGFYLPAPVSSRVNVDAKGSTGAGPAAMLGVQVGYEWNRLAPGQPEWALRPAVELEGLYITKRSPTGAMPITPGVLGTQYVTAPVTVGVLLANVAFTF